METSKKVVRFEDLSRADLRALAESIEGDTYNMTMTDHRDHSRRREALLPQLRGLVVHLREEARQR